MKIATFNVNGINDTSRLLRWLEEARAGVICLQELKAPDVRFPIREIEKADYGAIWHSEKSQNGFAIISRGREPCQVVPNAVFFNLGANCGKRENLTARNCLGFRHFQSRLP